MPRYDLHLQPLAPAVQRALRRPVGFGYVPAVAVRGMQALVDQWMRIYLTAKGSDPCDPNFGTGAVDLIGSTVTPEDAVELLSFHMRDCTAQMRAMQSKQRALEADEILDNAELVRAVTDPAGPGVEVWIRITNLAGGSQVVLLPNLVPLAER